MAPQKAQRCDRSKVDEQGWFSLDAENIDKHIPQGWTSHCVGDFSGSDKNGGVRLEAPDGTAYRLYASLHGFHMNAGIVDGPVVALDSDGQPTVEGTDGMTETVPFEDALGTITRKAQEYAQSDEKDVIRQRFQSVMERAEERRECRIRSQTSGNSEGVEA